MTEIFPSEKDQTVFEATETDQDTIEDQTMKFQAAMLRLLYIPTDKCHKLAKILEKYPHIKAFIFDNEDAIPAQLKNSSRQNFLFHGHNINNLKDQKGFTWGYRVNKPIVCIELQEPDHGRTDLHVVMPFKPDFLMIPKIKNRKIIIASTTNPIKK